MDIKDPAFTVISRQKQLFVPTNLASELSRAAMELIHESWQAGAPIRMLTITGINLCDETCEEQISLFAGDNESHQQGEKIERTMDDIRSRFGSAAITFGGVLGNDLGITIHEEEEREERE